jgi:hypothetical protein
MLIKITLECDGKPIEAVIDTGSQLNIASEKVYKSIIRRPLDKSASISMSDANGGKGVLGGIVENVPLDYGAVRTRANVYVGAHVPFDLLLGRPWQRGNMVSIDELQDGTYLVFKDPQTLEIRHTVLVTPDGTNPDWDHEPSSWRAVNMPMSFFVDIVTSDKSEGSTRGVPKREGRSALTTSREEPVDESGTLLRDRPENEIEIKMDTDLKWEVRRGIREGKEIQPSKILQAVSLAITSYTLSPLNHPVYHHPVSTSIWK